MQVNTKYVAGSFAVVAGLLLLSPLASANLKELKAYKEAFPDAKVKCASCHVATMPKKGAADLNEYGKAVAAAGATPTAEAIKGIGKAEDFKK